MTRKMFFGAVIGIISAPFVKAEQEPQEIEPIKLTLEVDTTEGMRRIAELEKAIKELKSPVITVKEFQECQDRIKIKGFYLVEK